ncbi:MAG: mycothiol synthase [Chloroflexota bacterium]
MKRTVQHPEGDIQIELIDRLDGPDREAVDALIHGAAHADGVMPTAEHKYLSLRSGAARARGLLLWQHGILAAYAQLLVSDGELTAELVTRPEHRRRGLARQLVAQIGKHAVAQRFDHVNVWAYGDLGPSQRVAAAYGLTPIRTLLQLEMSLETALPLANAAEYRIRSFRPGEDDEQWLALHNEVFRDHPENGKWEEADLQARLREPWFHAADFIVAERHGRMVGFNWTKRVPHSPTHRPEGEIYIIGVAESERGRGLGKALAVLGLEHMRHHGMKVAILYVEADNAPALALYRHLGFVVRHTHRCYRVSAQAAANVLSAESHHLLTCASRAD